MLNRIKNFCGNWKYKDLAVLILLGIDTLIYIFMLAFGFFFYRASDWNSFWELLNKGRFIPAYVIMLSVLLLLMFFFKFQKQDEDKNKKSDICIEIFILSILGFMAGTALLLSWDSLPIMHSFEWSDPMVKLFLFVTTLYYTYTIYMRFYTFMEAVEKVRKKHTKKEENNKA